VLEEARGARSIVNWRRRTSAAWCGQPPDDRRFVEAGAARRRNPAVLDYHEHAIGSGANAQAVAYLESHRRPHAVGVGHGFVNIVRLRSKAIVSGVQRATQHKKEATWQTN
jgi:2-isopropylmalate synthase